MSHTPNKDVCLKILGHLEHHELLLCMARVSKSFQSYVSELFRLHRCLNLGENVMVDAEKFAGWHLLNTMQTIAIMQLRIRIALNLTECNQLKRLSLKCHCLTPKPTLALPQQRALDASIVLLEDEPQLHVQLGPDHGYLIKRGLQWWKQSHRSPQWDDPSEEEE